MQGGVDISLLDVRTAEGLDPVLRALLIDAAAQGLPKLPEVTPEAARAYFEQVCAQLNATQDAPCKTEDLTLPGPDGALGARLYRQSDQPAQPGVILFFHGGGWVLGSIDSHDCICRHLSHGTGWPVLSVDYRLAPEHPFPAAIEDARTALAWLRDNACKLGVDSARIIVAGDSAGGNIAAALTLADRGNATPPLAGQILIYPAVAHDFDAGSMMRYASGFGLERGDMEWFVDHYHGQTAAPRDPLHSPLYADDLSGLPPAVVVTAGFDPLHDEGRAYGARLQDAGNTTAFRNFASLNHGFLKLAGVVPAARAALDEVLNLARNLTEQRAEHTAGTDPQPRLFDNQGEED
jgi:acetyl esterase